MYKVFPGEQALRGFSRSSSDREDSSVMVDEADGIRVVCRRSICPLKPRLAPLSLGRLLVALRRDFEAQGARSKSKSVSLVNSICDNV